MKKVMCFGTFDLLHAGHISYLEQAKKYGDYLIVIVARDENVKKLKKNYPKDREAVRLESIKKLKIIDKAVLGELKNRYKVIIKYKPDIICLGYDQQVDMEKLKEIFKGEIIRMKPYKEEIYKTSKINRI